MALFLSHYSREGLAWYMYMVFEKTNAKNKSSLSLPQYTGQGVVVVVEIEKEW